MRRSAYRLFVGNSAAALAGRLAALALALVLSTVLYKVLGAAAYGIWAFCYTLVGYQALFDLGLGPTVERLVARAAFSGERERVEEVLNHASALSIVIGVALVAIGAAVPLRQVGGVSVAPLRFLLPAAVLLSLLGSVAGAGLSGIQRFARLTSIRTVASVASAAIVLGLVAAGVRRLEWLLIPHVLGLGAAAVLAWLAVRRELGRLRFSPTLSDRSLLREFARFGGAVQLASFGPQLVDHAFRLLLGYRFGTPWMGYFDLGSRAAIVLRSIAGTVLVPLVPFGVQQHLEGGKEALTRLYELTVKYSALWLLPASALALYHSPLIVETWLGPSGTNEVLAVFRVFLVVNALIGLAAPIVMLGRAAGIPGAEATQVLFVAFAGLLVSAVASRPADAVTAFGACSVAGALSLWWRLGRRLVERSAVRGDLARVGAMTIAAVAATHLLARVMLEDAEGWTVFFAAAAAGGLPMVLVAAIAWRWGVIAPEERRFLMTVGRSSPDRWEER